MLSTRKGRQEALCNAIGHHKKVQKGSKQKLRASMEEAEKTDANGHKRNEFSREFCYITVCSGARRGQGEITTRKG